MMIPSVPCQMPCHPPQSTDVATGVVSLRHISGDSSSRYATCWSCLLIVVNQCLDGSTLRKIDGIRPLVTPSSNMPAMATDGPAKEPPKGESLDPLVVLSQVRVQFWKCLNPAHDIVAWEDGVATCATCGLTSEMTRRYRRLVERYTQEKLIERIQEAAKTRRDYVESEDPLKLVSDRVRLEAEMFEKLAELLKTLTNTP